MVITLSLWTPQISLDVVEEKASEPDPVVEEKAAEKIATIEDKPETPKAETKKEEIKKDTPEEKK